MFKFITSKSLFVNILAGAALALAIFAAIVFSLGWFTNHGDAKTVPPVLGKSLAEAQKILSAAGFEVEVQDSIYIDSLKPLQVIRQIPDEFEVVKSSRSVYITINRAVPPLIEMPKILGLSLRNAEMILKNNGLILGDTTFRPDFAVNSVLEQLYNGVPIQPGAQIRMGSRISLVIGSGIGQTVMAIPDLVGFTYAEAKGVLEEKGISLGAIIAAPEVKDTLNAFVFRQNPERFDEEGHARSIRQGQTMDLWLGIEKPVPKNNSDNTGTDSSKTQIKKSTKQ